MPETTTEPEGPTQAEAVAAADSKKLLRMLFALMAVHEHSFRVKDIAPGYLVGQYAALIGEIRPALNDDLRGELSHMFPISDDDPNLSEAQSTAASIIGWLNGVLITNGVVSISSPPQLPSTLMPPQQKMEAQGPGGQYL